MERARGWIQVDAGLARRGGTALPAARALLRALDADWPALARDARAGRIVFQRKPPDLRLRLHGAPEALRAALAPLLARLTGEGHVRGTAFAVYEPETRRFGGPTCMAAIHAHWSADTRLWIRGDRLAEAGMARLPADLAMAAVLNDLFWAALGDNAEVWDTWCNLLVLFGGGAPPAGPGPPPPFPEDLAPMAARPEAALLRARARGNARLAAALHAARARGRMHVGPRAVLAQAAMFTLNRHGFDRTAASALARGMAAAWDPAAHLRGARHALPRAAE